MPALCPTSGVILGVGFRLTSGVLESGEPTASGEEVYRLFLLMTVQSAVWRLLTPLVADLHNPIA